MIDRSRCPHPEKLVYTDKRRAKRALRTYTIFGRDSVHAYRCRCGYWHLGHKRRRPLAKAAA